MFGQALKHESLEKYFEAKVPSLKEFCRGKAKGDAKLTTSMLLECNAASSETLELTEEEIENLNAVRNQMRVAIGSLLKEDGILVIPTMPSVTPKLGSKEITSEDYQNRASSLLCVASISGMLSGKSSIQEKQWQKAIGLYSEAIKLNDNNGSYYSNRAAAYLELGSFRQAEADYTKALTLDKKNIKAYLRRGTARETLSAPSVGISPPRSALAANPFDTGQALKHESLEKYFEAKVPSLKEFCRGKAKGDAKLTTSMLLANVMQLLQSTVKPSIDPAIYSQLCKTLELTEEEIENLSNLSPFLNFVRLCIKEDGILVIPTMPSVTPKLGSKEITSEDYQNRA
ncbi:hypothetical protein Bca52824_002649 [Brassica carinata]|uniref:Uncharacterized protein n=1 Tax=Brassica carinata TaxID=52824 RepID=A0A8X7WIH7_BRACI|nr:hypothetical protein Bca52824_002649 [Brassica carinata]